MGGELLEMTHELHDIGTWGRGNEQMQVVWHEAVGKYTRLIALRGLTQGLQAQANRISVGEPRRAVSSGEGQREATPSSVCCWVQAYTSHLATALRAANATRLRIAGLSLTTEEGRPVEVHLISA